VSCQLKRQFQTAIKYQLIFVGVARHLEVKISPALHITVRPSKKASSLSVPTGIIPDAPCPDRVDSIELGKKLASVIVQTQFDLVSREFHSQRLHHASQHLSLVFLMMAVLTGVRNLSVLLICISFMAKDGEHFSCVF
jgi:hypothetical protein